MPTDPKPTIRKLQPGDPETQSADVVAENIAGLKALFPELVTEGKDGASVNLDVLKQLVGDATVTDCDEKFGLNWHGKRQARQLALTTSTGTLRPWPEESVDWDTTQNLFIEGDNLEVLKLLQKSYAGKVKMIYIDPPYNTGKDFVYSDSFQSGIQHYLQMTQQAGDSGPLSTNAETSGRFHTDWVSMLLPRLRLARDLLQDDGLIAISIDDNEVHHLRSLCADIFGEENFLGQLTVQSNPRGRQSDRFFATVHEYLLLYARDADRCSVRGAPLSESQRKDFALDDGDGRKHRLLGLRQRGAASRREDRPDMYFPIYVNPDTLEVSLEPHNGFTSEVVPRKSTGEDGRWMWGKDRCKKDVGLLVAKLIERRGEHDIFVKDYLDKGGSERTRKYKTIWDDKSLNTQNGTQEVKRLLGVAAMSFPKPVALLRDIVQLGTESSDLVVDFFAGSGTTGHAVFEQNAIDGATRRFVLVQLPEPLDSSNKEQKEAVDLCRKLGCRPVLSEVTKERLRRASKQVREDNPMFDGDLGFRVFKLDSSSIREWEPSREDIAESLEAHVENLRTGRTEQDILYELLLKRGLDLCVPIETKEIAGKTVHSIGAGTLFACLSESITAAQAEPLALGIVAWHQELAPAGEPAIIFRDSAFADDVVKANLAETLNQHGLTNVSSL